MKVSFPAFPAFLAFLAFLAFPAFSSDYPFIFPSNWGATGLMEIPTARVLKENSYRLGVSQIRPYRYYYGAVSPLPGLEIDGRITEILGVETEKASFTDYGNYKDKAVDIKYQFLAEGKYLPALAIGIMDPHGTRLYSSQYVTASKQIYPFDFTIGFGNGRYGDSQLPSSDEGVKLEMFSDTRDWLKESRFFGGISFSPDRRFTLMAEYSPISFHEQTRDPALRKYFDEPVPSKFNFGVRYRPADWAEVTVSYQRGNEIGINVSAAFEIGNPLIPVYEPAYKETLHDRTSTAEERIVNALYHSGFSDIGVVLSDQDIRIELQNDKYYFSADAIGVVLRTVSGMLPEGVKDIHLTISRNGIPQFTYHTTREDLPDLYAGRLTPEEFYLLSSLETDVRSRRVSAGRYRQSIEYGLRPALETLLNDPSGFFKYRFGVTGWADYHPWTGATLHAGVDTYPLNNIETTNEPLSIPVRSDIVLYKKESFQLGRLLFDQIVKLDNGMYGKVSVGLIEIEYAGVDAEVARSFFDGRLLLGIGGSAVKKREPDEPFKLKSDPVKSVFTTAFLNSRLNLPEMDLSLDIKAGRFLAGDKGVRLTVSKFINGVVLSAWYSFTNTNGFSDRFNRGYHDKGVSVEIPIRLFSGFESRRSFEYSITPWTRDVGQEM